MKPSRFPTALICLVLFTTRAFAVENVKVDVCVYGGTSAGVITAAAVAKEGKSVILIEQGRHLGGLTSGGLGKTDFGNKAVIGGMSREYYKRLGKHYGLPEVWTFEPSVAEKAFAEIVAENKVRVLLNHRLASLEKQGARITRIVLDHAPADDYNAPGAVKEAGAVIVEAAVFIDCGYEGDLMAKAGVKYTVGREGVAQYNEPLNGIRAATPKHQFTVKVDPYNKQGDPASGLLPLVQKGDGGKAGDGDKSVQAYNFRICVTNVKGDQMPFMPPPGYDAKTFELFARLVEAMPKQAGDKISLGNFLKIDMMQGGHKTDINNQGAVSTDYIGMNYAYPDADYAMRARIWRENRDYNQGLFYFIATSERLPANLRQQMNAWGLAKDEFMDTQGWPHQMYVREARRMIGRHVVTQADCEHKVEAKDSIGMGAYNMDSHNCQRFVKDGSAINEGDVQVGPKGPYPVGYASITPKEEECENLIVPVCLSATHIAYGSIRMEPVFMAIGESSAYAACMAINAKTTVQKIDYPKLREKLLAAGQVLEFKK
ncbi:MAG: xanthan lyase [Phycisphaerales bacterium]|nr:xanthan lyase [Phycisphaerales bacterium]